MPRRGAQEQVPESDSDQIRILIATDNHVGFAENDPIRGDDSWRTFDEIMRLAKERDVDMVLLGGDLFHDHTPTRKSMLQVIRSLRLNCLGDKPCELEFLSDGSEIFGGIFNKVNYEDPNINVAIPVFSIHGNHDEPTGHEFYAALDVLQQTGLINYFGRQNQNDKIEVKPVLLQKGTTKLALFGLSNVRDERLFREFRGGKVKFFRPGQSKEDWFNLMVVHQNHHSRTPTGYLPESFLPNFMDLVVWGHEHDCEIEPRYADEQGFHVIQPGSSIATQLNKGETIPKQVAILKVKGKNFQIEPIRLKTVRPFIFKEIILAEEKELKNLWKKPNSRVEITRHLKKIIKELVEQASNDWRALQSEESLARLEEKDIPLPLVRLRVDYTAPEGGAFDIENSQRITSDFMKTIANHNDVILFHMKKRAVRRPGHDIDIPEQFLEGQEIDQEDDPNIDSVQMGNLVREFLQAQSLSVLPQNRFNDAVVSYVDNNDRDAMATFVKEQLNRSVKNLLQNGAENVEDVEILQENMEEFRIQQENLLAANGHRERSAKSVVQDSNDGDADASGIRIRDDDSDVVMVSETPPIRAGAKKGSSTARGRGNGRGAKASTASSRGGGRTARGRNIVEDDEEEENESDINMQLDSDSESQSRLFVSNKPSKSAVSSRNTAASKKSAAANKPPAKASKTTTGSNMRQAKLDFSQPATTTTVSPRSTRTASRNQPFIEISDDDIEDDDDDDDDAFEALPPKRTTGKRR